MKHKALSITALLSAAFLAATVSAQGGGPAPGAFPILLCDFGDILQKCEEAKDIEDAFSKEQKAKKDELEKRGRELEAKIRDIKEKKMLSERDEQTYAALKEAIEEKGRLDAAVAYENIRGQDYIQRRMQELLRGARQYADAVMRQRQAHMVIATKIGPIQLENQQDFQDEMLRRRVFTHVNGVDITGEVMKRMNDDYAKRKKQ